MCLNDVVDKATGKPIAGSKAALVYGQMNEPPGARARVALTGLAIAGELASTPYTEPSHNSKPYLKLTNSYSIIMHL